MAPWPRGGTCAHSASRPGRRAVVRPVHRQVSHRSGARQGRGESETCCCFPEPDPAAIERHDEASTILLSAWWNGPRGSCVIRRRSAKQWSLRDTWLFNLLGERQRAETEFAASGGVHGLTARRSTPARSANNQLESHGSKL